MARSAPCDPRAFNLMLCAARSAGKAGREDTAPHAAPRKNVNDLHSNPYPVLRRVLVGVYLRAAPWLVSRVSMCTGTV